jgi:hypothetical protein
MFHACPVKIMITEASSSPTLLRGKAAKRPKTSPGHETQDRDGLQHVEDRDEGALGDPVARRPVPVDEREGEGQQVGGEAAGQGEERVARQRRGGEVDLDRGAQDARPLAREEDEPVDGPAEPRDEREIRPPEPLRAVENGDRRAEDPLYAPAHPGKVQPRAPERERFRVRSAGPAG